MNNYRLSVRFTSLIFAILLVTVSCKEEKKAVPPPPEITVVNVIQKDVPIFEKFVGQVYGFADIPIRARVRGFLTGIHFREGFPIKKGQLLYTIDPEEYKAKVATQKSHLAEAQTSLAKAESDLNRIKPLAKINAVSKSDLDAAQANYDAAKSYVNAMKSNLKFAEINLGYCWIKSPIDGLIGKTKARVGEFVGQNPNPVILNTVSTTDSVRVEFFLTEADYIVFAREYNKSRNENNGNQDNDNVKQNVSLILADGSTFKYNGELNFINREVDPQTGTLLVESVFPNPEHLLKPGQYAKVVVKIEEVKDALLIPARCISELQGQYSVYVVKNDNTVENRQIKAGERIGDMQIVSEGLQPGDKVVIDALQKVKSGLTIKPVVIDFKSKSTIQE
jgi:membrane fusion protein (multidrug efflux system)